MHLDVTQINSVAEVVMWPYIVIHACLISSPAVCQDVYLPVNWEDRGVLGAPAVELTCQMTFFRTVVAWEQQHAGWRSHASGCRTLDPDSIPKGA